MRAHAPRELFKGDAEDARRSVKAGEILFHAGRIKGALPRVISLATRLQVNDRPENWPERTCLSRHPKTPATSAAGPSAGGPTLATLGRHNAMVSTVRALALLTGIACGVCG